jgi:maltokinase
MTATADTWRGDRLDALLTAWLPWQRWFAGKGRPVAGVRVVQAVELADALERGGPLGKLLIADVRFADGGPPHRYQVPIGFRRIPGAVGHQAVIAGIDDLVCYDALHDPQLVLAVLRLMAAGTSREGIRWHAGPGLAGLLDDTTPVRVLDAEQSNTSVVIGERAILKVFRRLHDGRNPDLELHEALGRAGNGHVAGVLGAVEGEPPGPPVTYAVLQSYAATAVDGWALALASVRDLVDNQVPRRPAGSAGGDFGPEAYRLGQTIARVHADLASELGTADLGRTALADLATRLSGELTETLDAVPALARHAPALRAAYARLVDAGSGLRVQRIHGDLHLGQALRTPTAWWLIDFEGAPVHPLAYRRLPQCPLQDIAGMLRSFDYAAHHDPEDAGGPDRDRRVAGWLDRNREALCRGYASVTGTDPRAGGVVLHALELARAVYEAGYEARHRPGWLRIPLAALDRLLAGED